MFNKYCRVNKRFSFYRLKIFFISFKRSYLTGSRVAMNPDPYRGIWGGQYCRDSPIQTTRSCNCSKDHCQASDRYVEQVEEILNYEVSKKKVAGIFIESIQVYFIMIFI
jgi:hypothetical protein